jgi:hypothetical protein
MNIHQWKRHIKEFNRPFSEDDDQHKEWNNRTLENLPYFKKEKSIWNLEFKYYGEDEKAMVLVGSSPCLKRDVDKLKDLDDDFVIVCANSSLKFLLRNGIKPHYVVAVDSDDKDITQHLDIADSKDITLLASTVISNKILDAWQGPVYFLPYYSIKKELKGKVRSRLGKGVPSGGNCITSAFYVVSIIFGSKTVIFVGNEHCFDKVKDYYADKKAAKQEKLKLIFPIKDVLGRDRWTLPAHYNYAIWTEKVCDDLSPKGYFIDTSFGLLGKDSKNIHNMEISEAIGHVKWSFKMKRKVNTAKTEKEKLSIIEGIKGKDEQSEVYRYNVHEYRERILQLARS